MWVCELNSSAREAGSCGHSMIVPLPEKVVLFFEDLGYCWLLEREYLHLRY